VELSIHGHRRRYVFGYDGDSTWDRASGRGIGAFSWVSKPGSLIKGYSVALSPLKGRELGISPGQEFVYDGPNDPSQSLVHGATYRWDDRPQSDTSELIDVYDPDHPPDKGVSAATIAEHAAARSGIVSATSRGRVAAPKGAVLAKANGQTNEQAPQTQEPSDQQQAPQPAPLGPGPRIWSELPAPLSRAIAADDRAPASPTTPLITDPGKLGAFAPAPVGENPEVGAPLGAVPHVPLKQEDIDRIMDEASQDESLAKLPPKKRADTMRKLQMQRVHEAHAEALYPEDQRVALRTNPDTGSQRLVGQYFVPGDPVHDNLLGALHPDHHHKLGLMSQAIAQTGPTAFMYYSAKQEGGPEEWEGEAPTAESRMFEQQHSTPDERVAELEELRSQPGYQSGVTTGPLGQWQQTAVIPMQLVASGPTSINPGKIGVEGLDAAKVANNARHLFSGARAAGIKLPYEQLQDPNLAADVAGYLENQSHGFRGDGSQMVDENGQPHPLWLANKKTATPYVPRMLARPNAEFVHAMLNVREPKREKPADKPPGFKERARWQRRVNEGFFGQKAGTNRLLAELDRKLTQVGIRGKKGEHTRHVPWSEGTLEPTWDRWKPELMGPPAGGESMRAGGLHHGVIHKAPLFKHTLAQYAPPGARRKLGPAPLPLSENPEVGAPLGEGANLGSGAPGLASKGDSKRRKGKENAQSHRERLASYIAALEATGPAHPLSLDPAGEENWEDVHNQISRDTYQQQLALLAHAQARGELLPPPRGPAHAGGGEHNVYFETPERVRKVTLAHTYGYTPRIANRHTGFDLGTSMREATPLEYLKRIALANEHFGDDVRLEGITQAGRNPRYPRVLIHTSQPRYGESIPPTGEAVDEYMLDHGFVPNEKATGQWDHPSGTIAADAEPRNFVSTPKGVQAVDILLRRDSPTPVSENPEVGAPVGAKSMLSNVPQGTLAADQSLTEDESQPVEPEAPQQVWQSPAPQEQALAPEAAPEGPPPWEPPGPGVKLKKPKAWKEQPESVKQAYLEHKVGRALDTQYRGPETHELVPLRHDDGRLKYDPEGNPVYRQHDYNIVNSPLLKAKGLDRIKDADTHEDTIDKDQHKHLNATERRRLSAMRKASAVTTMGDKIVESYMGIKDKPAIMAGEGWYQRMRDKLSKELKDYFKGTKHEGKDAHELFAQLLGATSAQTPVRTNFIQALDALEQFRSGKFDKHVDKYLEAYRKLKEGGAAALTAHMKELGIPLYGVDQSGKKLDTVTEHEKDAAAMANWIHYHGIMPRQKKQADQTIGSKYNANSMAVLRALAGTWLEEIGAPKTPNFAGNLTGRTLEATIDVWAARHLQRLGYEGLTKGKPWRAQSRAEPGVSGIDFAFAQDAMRHAADEITKKTGKKMNPDDLQAILWFAEKHEYEKRGWTRGQGAEKSSFDDVADLAFPKSGKSMSSDDLRDYYAKIAMAKEGLERYEGHKKPKMAAKLEPWMTDRKILPIHIAEARKLMAQPEEEED